VPFRAQHTAPISWRHVTRVQYPNGKSRQEFRNSGNRQKLLQKTKTQNEVRTNFETLGSAEMCKVWLVFEKFVFEKKDCEISRWLRR
jgi:hypothetical protein